MVKLLICDDERRIREGVKQGVDWASIGVSTVETAEDGAEGWEWVKVHQPELVITDIRMPRMDGLELLHKTMVAYPYTKVILLSGYEDFHYAQNAIRSRAFDYVLKPTNPTSLIEICKRALKELEDQGKRMVLTEEGGDDPGRMAERIVAYVQEHYSEAISLESAAHEVHVSTVHLNRIMKREIGMTFLEYLTHVRLEEAKRLLKLRQYTVQEICYQIGYGDPKYFSQLFRKMVGCKPSEYAAQGGEVRQ